MLNQIVLYSGPKESFWIVKDVLNNYDVVYSEPSESELHEKFKTCAAFLDASMKVRIPAEIIKQAENLRVVSTATTGADHIDKDELEKRGVSLLTLKGQSDVLSTLTGAAEHSFLLLMACARQLRSAINHVIDGKWERIEFPGIMLRGKTLGLIGCGRIGTWMSRYAKGFEMRVIAYDPFVKFVESEVKLVDFDTLLSESDFISIHIHLSDETRNMIGKNEIDKMKKGVVIINTSRGDIVDEEAFVKGLENKIISAVGVDVITDEPVIFERPLYKYAKEHDNVVITPHIGGYCPESVDIVVRFAAERIKEYLK